MKSPNLHRAILDACVLYPAPLRDLVLSFAAKGLFIPKWSEEINREWIRNLLKNRPDLKYAQLESTKDAMNNAFNKANVVNYSPLISSITLPDENDRHVVAAAIKANADFIVTFNLKDFPSDVVSLYNISIIHPDYFLVQLFDLNPQSSIEAFNDQVGRLTNPPLTNSEVLKMIKRSGVERIVEKLSISYHQ